MSTEELGPLPRSLFDRLDNSPDRDFYRAPRFVAHIDDETIAALSGFYGEMLFPGADVLDLMSSWISHLPDEPALGRIAGLGMNRAELAANPALTEYLVHDLNTDPTLPYTDETFDFVFIAVSIQYLIRPLEVFAEIGRVLRTGGIVAVSCSHRCFPTKAIRAFHEADPDQRPGLIAEYIRRAGAFGEAAIIDRSPVSADPLWLVCAERQ